MPNPTAWWFRPVINAARVGEHSAVTWKPLYRRPQSANRSSTGVRIGPPNVAGLPKPASSIRTSNTLGAASGAAIDAAYPQSGSDPSSVRLTTPWNGGRRIGSVLLSISWSLTCHLDRGGTARAQAWL